MFLFTSESGDTPGDDIYYMIEVVDKHKITRATKLKAMIVAASGSVPAMPVRAQRLEGRLFNTKGWVEEFQVRVSFMV